MCGEALAVVVSAGRIVVLSRGLVGLIVVEGLLNRVVIQRLASEEGCACLVVSNFGELAAATGGWSRKVLWRSGGCVEVELGVR